MEPAHALCIWRHTGAAVRMHAHLSWRRYAACHHSFKMPDMKGVLRRKSTKSKRMNAHCELMTTGMELKLT